MSENETEQPVKPKITMEFDEEEAGLLGAIYLYGVAALANGEDAPESEKLRSLVTPLIYLLGKEVFTSTGLKTKQMSDFARDSFAPTNDLPNS